MCDFQQWRRDKTKQQQKKLISCFHSIVYWHSHRLWLNAELFRENCEYELIFGMQWIQPFHPLSKPPSPFPSLVTSSFKFIQYLFLFIEQNLNIFVSISTRNQYFVCAMWTWNAYIIKSCFHKITFESIRLLLLFIYHDVNGLLLLLWLHYLSCGSLVWTLNG